MRKRILLIGHSADMYGASRSLTKLVQILNKDYLVYVMLPEKGPLYEILVPLITMDRIIVDPGLYIFTRKSFKLQFFPGTLLRFIRNIRSIRKIIKNYNIDIVHTNSGVIPAAALAAKSMGKTHLWHIREWFGDFKRFWPYYSAYMTRFSDKIICVSQTMASQFSDHENVLSIFNGFSIPVMNTDKRPATTINSLAGADLILGCTSRIRLKRKGQEYLIEAIALCAKRSGKKIHLVLIGDFVPGYEHEKAIITDLINKHKLEEQVHFLGHIAEPLPYYSLFDVFVLPSGEPEPFGGVVMEAMSMGLPIIGSNLGGTREQVKDGWNGYLFENQDPVDLASKIELFLDDKSKIELFGERSKERVAALFSLELHEQKILQLYQSLQGPN